PLTRSCELVHLATQRPSTSSWLDVQLGGPPPPPVGGVPPLRATQVPEEFLVSLLRHFATQRPLTRSCELVQRATQRPSTRSCPLGHAVGAASADVASRMHSAALSAHAFVVLM